MINYFDYQYDAPTTRDTPFKVATELSAAPWNPDALLLKVGIKGFEVAAKDRPPANLVFLIDVSGSMAGAPIVELNSGLQTYRDELAADSLAAKRVEVAVLTFGGSVDLVLARGGPIFSEVPKICSNHV